MATASKATGKTRAKTFSLAFSGSGYLVPIHGGAACAILDKGHKIVETAGTSGGSIIAAAIALGMTSTEIKDMALNTSFKGLLKPNIFSIFKNKAFSDGNALLAVLQTIFGGKTMSDAVMPCSLLSTHVEAGASYEFTPASDGNTSVSLACRASAAVPFIYAPVIYNGMTLVDGGVINNIPVDRLIAPRSIKIGVDVDESTSYSFDGLFSYASSLIGMMLSANENTHVALGKLTGVDILAVPTKQWFLDTDMMQSEKERLFLSGYNTMLDQLQRY